MLTPGLVKTAFVDDSGLISNPWAKYLESLENGTASTATTGLTAADLTRIAAIEAQIANILLRLRALELGVQM